MPPEAIRRAVEAAVEGVTGRPVRLARVAAVGGGCVTPSARIVTADGDGFFLKWGAVPPGAFEREAEGLRALRDAGAAHGIRVPEVVASGGAPGVPPWLLLELVERGAARPGYGPALGRGLAGLHGAGTGEGPAYGWDRDNFIGPLPQANPRSRDWAAFWRDARLAPQLELARRGGHLRGGEGSSVTSLLERVEDALGGANPAPSLLHGDLWSGNAYPGPSGEPVLVDPAVYRGDREVDLAMSELFGGFPGGFFEGYREASPLAAGYRRVRRPLYQLYYLLVHVNLFGGSYVAATLRAASEVLDAL